MKNYEKYENELKRYEAEELCSKLIKPIILKKDSCPSNNCKMCCRLLMLWMGEEYKPEPPKVDWSKVKVDTPILVRQGKNGEWLERHFAKYENGNVYAWVDGQTSWTGADNIKWKYAKLAEGEEECEEPEVDWSKVEVDTPILVSDVYREQWFKRYFAEYKGGVVYAWHGGGTSWTEDCRVEWSYAKLAESEETK